MKMWIRTAAVGSLAAAAALSLCAWAQDAKPQIARVIFGHYDESDVPTKEIVTGRVTLPPGAVIPFHTHPGDEAGYVVKGSLTWKIHGKPDKTLHAGDSFFNPRGAEHSVVAGEDGAEAVSTWIVDKGKPMSSP